MNEILVKLRDLLQDNYKYVGDDVQTYTTSLIFTLQYANIDSSTLVVLRNGATYSAANYTYSSTTGKVTVTGSLTAGDILTFSYNAYMKYSDASLQAYIRSALYYLTSEKYKIFTVRPPTYVVPTPTEEETSLIAVIAGILIKGSVRQYRTPEFTIIFDDNEPVEKRIKRAVNQFKIAYGVFEYIDPEDEAALPDEDDDE